MRLSFPIAVTAAGLAAYVEASVRAGAYNTMFLWNAYQIEIETFGVGNTITAPGCNAAAETPRPCSFDEFIKYIETKSSKTPGFEGTTGKTGRELPVIETAEELKRLKYSALTDYKVLYPVAFAGRDKSPSLSTLLDNTMDAIQKARETTKNPAGIAKFLSLAEEALEAGIKMRQADQMDGLINALKAWLRTRAPDFDIKYEQPETVLPDGKTYKKVDLEASIADETNKANIPGNQARFLSTFDKMIKEYDKQKGDPVKHAAAIHALQGYVKKLQQPASAAGCSS